jgi:hypothetical protein
MNIPTLTASELYKGIRIVGVFTSTQCLGYVKINIYGPDVFDYKHLDELGIRVLVV